MISHIVSYQLCGPASMEMVGASSILVIKQICVVLLHRVKQEFSVHHWLGGNEEEGLGVLEEVLVVRDLM